CCKGNNYEQRFARTIGGMSKAKRSISWHPFSPWQNSSELGSAHGLSKALYFVVYHAAGL
ncbi:MAG: hypothetical protein UFP31_10075, partial [Prevotella sp.]|nr:hypothetical protein [Prevotella sp.]